MCSFCPSPLSSHLLSFPLSSWLLSSSSSSSSFISILLLSLFCSSRFLHSEPPPTSENSVEAAGSDTDTHTIILIIMVPLGRLDRMRKEKEGNERNPEGTEATIYDQASRDWLAGVGGTSSWQRWKTGSSHAYNLIEKTKTKLVCHKKARNLTT